MDELQVISAKRTSLRDKLKRRREALGSILAQTSAEKINQEEPQVKKVEVNEVQQTSESNVQINLPRHKRTSTSESESDLQSLLHAQSAKEKADQQHRDEILDLLGRPTAKEQVLLDSFRSQTGSGVKEFCSHSTKIECIKSNENSEQCEKLHFAKILQPHTDESLGDCSFLNTCFHMDTCKYIHYEVDAEDIKKQRYYNV